MPAAERSPLGTVDELEMFHIKAKISINLASIQFLRLVPHDLALSTTVLIEISSHLEYFFSRLRESGRTSVLKVCAL